MADRRMKPTRTVNKNTQICISIAEKPGNFGSQFHNLGYELLGLNYLYFPRQISASALPKTLESVRTLSIIGCSVSMPHKEKVMAYLDQLDDSAVKVGAVNTIKNVQGRLVGYNTDFYGAQKVLRAAGIKGKEVVLIGAGGVAKAIAHAVRESGGRLSIINRNEARAAALADKTGGRALTWDRLDQIDGEILIQATPVGMHDSESSIVSKSVIQRFSIVQDVVLDPCPTRLVREALALEKVVFDGKALCYHQTAEQFRIYTGIQPPLDQIKALMEKPIRKSQSGVRSGSQRQRA